jgi:hypothetical protein
MYLEVATVVGNNAFELTCRRVVFVASTSYDQGRDGQLTVVVEEIVLWPRAAYFVGVQSSTLSHRPIISSNWQKIHGLG